jgi:hypothetical protein
MADTILEVGYGKTYSGVNGFIDALDDLPSDMDNVDGNIDIVLYPDYVYNWIPTSRTYNPINPSSSKKITIRPAEGYEHRGVFDAGVIILYDFNDYVNFINYYDYFEIRDIQFRLPSTADYSRFFRFYGIQNNVKNCLVENNGAYTYCFQYLGSSGGIFANNILWSKTSSVYLFECYSTGVMLVLNNLAHEGLLNFGNNSNLIAINNGSVGTGSFKGIQNTTGINGGGNYKTTGGDGVSFGDNFYTASLSTMQFRGIANKNLKLKLTSPLINSGSTNSDSNPKSINGEPWNGNHRSPYNNMVITNAYIQPPEDTEYIRGNWMNGMIYNCLQPGGKIVIGELTNLLAYGSHILGYDYAGFSTKCAYSTNYNTLLRPINGKFLTISTLIKRFGSSGLNSNPLGNGVSYLTVDTSATNRIRFTIDTDYYADSTSLSSYVNVNDYFNVICQVNLEATTNAERIKIYLYQKGFLNHVALTFTGTPPSSFNEDSSNWVVGYHADYQGITSVWDRLLAFEEIYTIAYDPYVIYRSDKKLFRMLNIIPEGLGNGLWFLRKFIMGN